MPKRSRKEISDPNRSAFRVLKHTMDTEETPKNPAAVALGRLGGLKGGRARAEKLTDEQRRASAKKAAEARWKDRQK